MSKIVEIDLKNVVNKITGLDLELYQSIPLSKNCQLYRFGEEDEVHLVTDGAGGYVLTQDPMSGNEKTWNGHLGDLS